MPNKCFPMFFFISLYNHYSTCYHQFSSTEGAWIMINTCAHVRTSICMYTHARAHTSTHTHMCTHSRAHVWAHMQTHTCKHRGMHTDTPSPPPPIPPTQPTHPTLHTHIHQLHQTLTAMPHASPHTHAHHHPQTMAQIPSGTHQHLLAARITPLMTQSYNLKI